jgi:hypothetical protein
VLTRLNPELPAEALEDATIRAAFQQLQTYSVEGALLALCKRECGKSLTNTHYRLQLGTCRQPPTATRF